MNTQAKPTAEQFAQATKVAQAMRAEVGKALVGQAEVVDHVLCALLAGGHVLVEGVPGLGKTLLVRASALISSVLPRPGTPSTSTWPPASSAHSTESITSGWPMIALPISARIAPATLAAWPNCSGVGLVILFPSPMRCARAARAG